MRKYFLFIAFISSAVLLNAQYKSEVYTSILYCMPIIPIRTYVPSMDIII